MLKFLGQDGKLKMVLFDDEDEPRILNDETKKLLTSMGIEFEDLDPIPMTKIKVKKEK